MSEQTIPITVTFNLPLSMIQAHLPSLLSHVSSAVTVETDDIQDLVELVKKTKKEKIVDQPVAQHSTLDVIKEMDDQQFDDIVAKVGFKEADAATARRLRNELKEGKALDLAVVTQLISTYKQDNQLDLTQLAELFQALQPKKETQPSVVEKKEQQTPPPQQPAAPAFDLNQMMSAFAPMLNNLQRGGAAGRGKRNRKR